MIPLTPLLASLPEAGLSIPVKSLAACDVVWNSPSDDAAGSMPIGNGEVVLNVWVEKSTGDLLFYIARSGALSEISRVLKLGQVRVHFTRPVFQSKSFRQHLALRDGVIRLTGGGVRLNLFVDSDAQVIHISGTSSKPIGVIAKVEDWRKAARELPGAESGSAWTAKGAPVKLIESADVFVPTDGRSVTWYHRNETSIVPVLWKEQSLTGLAGARDTLIHRTFGGRLAGYGFKAAGSESIASKQPVKNFDLHVATYIAQTPTADLWIRGVKAEAKRSPSQIAERRTVTWWHAFWNRSWVFTNADQGGAPIPHNDFPLRKGVDSNGQNVFPGTISDASAEYANKLDLKARIKVDDLRPGRIFDKLTAGSTDGFLFDTYPGDGLRLIVGNLTLTAPQCLKSGDWHDVEATYDPESGEAAIVLDGKQVAHQPGSHASSVTQGYVLQRYVQACQGRGEYPIKFNGGYYTVEPKAMGMPYNADFRNWGDSQWYQNVRHMSHPMPASGDFEMMDPFFRLYESNRKLAESRTRLYHHAEGAYFPETMTDFGTYAGDDYGWNREGHEPSDVQSPWWRYAWNQGPELVALMLDRWDYTMDPAFLKKRLVPMAKSVLTYFDTRFKKDDRGRIILDPTQSIETYWSDVIDDMPSTAGLIAVTERLCKLPAALVSQKDRAFFKHMHAACPELPMRTVDGEEMLSPAKSYSPKTTNVENPELYAVWPFKLVTVGHPQLLQEAKRAYAARLNHLDVGWGYDGNVAALLGMTDEAARILVVKCHNSHAGYRWPATWGPNFDWLPDQNHGGNLLNTADLMLIQADPLSEGGVIRVLPAWPKSWDVDFKLHAPGNTIVHCIAKGGKIEKLEVWPRSRRKDVVLPEGWR